MFQRLLVGVRLERRVNPANALVAASAGHDLVVLGSYGRRGFDKVMGSVAEAVARRAQASVLIVKPAAEAA